MNITDKPVRRDSHRTINFDWTLQEISPILTEIVTLRVSHYTDRKCFSATLSKEKVEQTPHGSIHAYEVFGGVTLLREGVARFSQKALETFASKALDHVRHYVHEEEAVIRVFTPSDRSCGCTDMHHVAGCPVYRAEAEALNAGRRR